MTEDTQAASTGSMARFHRKIIRRSRPDPYSSCPCGSGKKFKFCCYKPDETVDKQIETFKSWKKK